MKYILSVEVKLQEVPDEEPLPMPRPGDDPMASFGPAIKLMTGAIARPMMFSGGQAGFDFRKSATVTVPSFPALARIIGKFDDLVHEVEIDAMARHEP